MEGGRVLLKEGPSPSKPPPHPENFPHDPAIYEAEIRFALHGGGVMGEVFVVGGVWGCYRVRLSHLFCGWDEQDDTRVVLFRLHVTY